VNFHIRCKVIFVLDNGKKQRKNLLTGVSVFVFVCVHVCMCTLNS
jgi:hypothetical protein